MPTSKMYIAILETVPDYIAPTLVAHAVLGYHLQPKMQQGEDLYNNWLRCSFKKVTLRVNQKEFDKISLLPNVGLFHENKTLDGKKSCAVIVVDKEVPNVLKFAKMWETS